MFGVGVHDKTWCQWQTRARSAGTIPPLTLWEVPHGAIYGR